MLKCFKAYDIRGKLGDELNPDVAYRIGYAYAQHLNAKRVVVGGDIRHTSEPLKLALAQGLMDAGAEVIDIGMVGTEEIYFASFYLDVDGGIEVTASHNPMDYNGMKLVGRGALPISGDSGLNDIRDLAEKLVSPYQTGAGSPRPDGLAMTDNIDGLAMTNNIDGLAVTNNIDGLAVTDNIDGVVKTGSADGSVMTESAGGFTMTKNVDGFVITKNADGLAMTESTDGFAMMESADGLVKADSTGGSVMAESVGDFTMTKTVDGFVITKNADSLAMTEKADDLASSDKNSVIASAAKQSSAVAETQDSPLANHPNRHLYQKQSILTPYIEHLLTYVDLTEIKPLKLVVNAGNGAAGHVIDAIEKQFASANVPVEFIKVHHEPDGDFPNGIPNPLLPENRAATADAVIEHKADMGIAWDGDFDRCFLFDENGRFIEGYYIVGLLAEAFLIKSPGEKIIHDPRLTWNTIDQVEAAAGKPIQSKTGHAFIKERMRLENAVYGGEMSAHHYFRDFAYCDSGMIPWLLVAELLSISGKPLSELVNQRMKKYPCSGEINYRVEDAAAVLQRIQAFYAPFNPHIDTTDGISLEFENWRFNLRTSNTEPLLRLNIETRGDADLVQMKVKEIEGLIQNV